MTPDDVRAAAERLVDFHERFAPLFGKEGVWQRFATNWANAFMIHSKQLRSLSANPFCHRRRLKSPVDQAILSRIDAIPQGVLG